MTIGDPLAFVLSHRCACAQVLGPDQGSWACATHVLGPDQGRVLTAPTDRTAAKAVRTMAAAARAAAW